jgi:hypothetical protein
VPATSPTCTPSRFGSCSNGEISYTRNAAQFGFNGAYYYHYYYTGAAAGPLVEAVVYVGLARQHGPTVDVCLPGAAIGPMNPAAILTERYDLDPPPLVFIGWWLYT